MKSKKGGMADLFIFMIFAVVIVFISGIFIYLGSTVTTEVHDKMDGKMFGDRNATIVVEDSLGAVNESYQALYWISVFLIVGMILSIFIGSYLVTTKPVFFIPYAFIVIIAVIVATGLSNAYETVIADPTLSSTFDGFVGANFIILQLPIWITVIGIVGGIIMFVRMGSKENDLYGGGILMKKNKLVIFFFVVIISIISIPLLLALEFDNILTTSNYGDKYPELTIKNAFGLGSEVVKMRLINDGSDCFIDCSATLEITLYEDGTLPVEFEAYDRKNNLLSKEFKYYYEVKNEQNILKQHLKETCEKRVMPNSSIQDFCSSINDYNYTEKITSFNLVEYKGETLKAGTYKYLVTTKRKPNQAIDWTFKYYGIPSEDIKEYYAWWDSSWAKKKQLEIKDNAGISVVNASVIIDVIYDADMQTDFDDLRFTTYDETIELPYWIETKTNGVNATIYLKTNISASANTSVFMYYGNSGATTGSNMTRAFYLGNDWTKWTNWTGSGWGLNGSGMDITFNSWDGLVITSSFYEGLFMQNRISLDYPFQIKVWGYSATTYGLITLGDDGTCTDPANNCAMFYMMPGDGAPVWRLTTTSTYSVGKPLVSVNYTSELIRYNTTSYGLTFTNVTGKYYFNSTSTKNYANNGFLLGSSSATSYVRYRQSAVMPYLMQPVSFSFGTESSQGNLTATLNSPIDNYITKLNSTTFNCSATDETGVLNLTLRINDTDIYTINGGTGVNLSLQTTRILTQGNYNWTCRASDGENIDTPTIRNFNIDYYAPNVSISHPNISRPIILRELNTMLNFSVKEIVSTDDCWFNINNGANRSLYSTCHTSATISSNAFFNNTFNGRQTLYFFANDSADNKATTSISWYVYNYSDRADGTTIGEGDSVTFNLSLQGEDINSYYLGSNATLMFNSIPYAPDTTIRTYGNYTYFEKTLVIPIGSGNSTGKNVNYFWNYQIRNSSTSILAGATPNRTISVYNMTISDCDQVLGKVILNLSLKDEELNSLVNITSPNTAVIEIDMNISSWLNSSQSWSFAKKWESNNSVAVCVPFNLLNITSYKIDFTIGYESTGKVKKFYYLDNGTLDNTGYFNSYTDNTIDLMDLLSADSTTFLFTFTDEDGLEVEDAIIHTYRKYIGEGLFREVERSRQDNNGETHLHLVEEDVIYYFMVSQYGRVIYTSDTYNAKCLSNPCEISLSASPSETNWSEITNEGGRYSISSNRNTRRVTLTFTLPSSALVNLSLFSYNGSIETFVNGTSLESDSGSMYITVPTSFGNKTFLVAIFNNNEFVRSELVDFTTKGRVYFGTMGAILSGLIVLCLIFMAISEGVVFIVMLGLSLVVISTLKLVDLNWAFIISIILAGAIIIFKIAKRSRNA